MTHLICLLTGHKYKSTGTILFGMLPGTPVCVRCGKYAGAKSKPTKKEEAHNE